MWSRISWPWSATEDDKYLYPGFADAVEPEQSGGTSGTHDLPADLRIARALARRADLRPRHAWKGQPEGTRGPRRHHQRPLLGRRPSRVGTTAWVSIARKVGVGVLVAA